MKKGLWGIVNETEAAPNAETHTEQYAKFVARRDRASAVIVLEEARRSFSERRGPTNSSFDASCILYD